MLWRNILPQKRWSTNSGFVNLADISLDCMWQCRKTTECIDTGMTLSVLRLQNLFAVWEHGLRQWGFAALHDDMLTCWNGIWSVAAFRMSASFLMQTTHDDVHFREVDARTRQSIKTIFFETTMNLSYMNVRKFMSKYWKINALGCWWSHSFCRKHRSALRPKHFSENVFCCVCWLLCSQVAHDYLHWLWP